jgi:hypothetical protein
MHSISLFTTVPVIAGSIVPANNYLLEETSQWNETVTLVMSGNMAFKLKVSIFETTPVSNAVLIMNNVVPEP